MSNHQNILSRKNWPVRFSRPMTHTIHCWRWGKKKTSIVIEKSERNKFSNDPKCLCVLLICCNWPWITQTHTHTHSRNATFHVNRKQTKIKGHSFLCILLRLISFSLSHSLSMSHTHNPLPANTRPKIVIIHRCFSCVCTSHVFAHIFRDKH